MLKKYYRRLCKAERAVIEGMNKEGMSQVAIADVIGFSQSTISKELKRNGGLRGYRHKQAQGFATRRKESKRSRPRKIVEEVQDEVEERLLRKHSPEQISGAFARLNQHVSHEAIYRHIAVNKDAGGDLWRHLRINNRKRRRPRVKASRERIAGRTSLEKRPKAVERRSRFGDWEADLIEGRKGSGYLLSLYERKSRLGRLVKLETKGSKGTTLAIIATLRAYKVRTITYDNGLEFSGHLEVTEALEAKGYFCQPYHSWEKGGVENFNGLVRQYYPKGMDFSPISEQNLMETERELNQRPRKSLDYMSPADLEQQIAA